MNEGLRSDLLEEFTWLYRGVPIESDEIQEVLIFGELTPPRADRTGEKWRQLHLAGETNTAYTSWTIDRSIAIDAATAMSEEERLSTEIRVLRVRIDSLDEERLFFGRDDEDEYLIEGRVENVGFSTMEEDDD
jgi:hypothetical protein